MPITQVETIAVLSDYRPCTKNSKLYYSEFQKALDRHTNVNTRKWQIAELLHEHGESMAAEKMIRWKPTMVGNVQTICDLPTTASNRCTVGTVRRSKPSTKPTRFSKLPSYSASRSTARISPYIRS